MTSNAETCRQLLEQRLKRLETYSAVAESLGDISLALGLKEREYRRCAHFGYGPEARAEAEEWDEFAAGYGGLTEICRKVLSGDLELLEQVGR